MQNVSMTLGKIVVAGVGGLIFSAGLRLRNPPLIMVGATAATTCWLIPGL